MESKASLLQVPSGLRQPGKETISGVGQQSVTMQDRHNISGFEGQNSQGFLAAYLDIGIWGNREVLFKSYPQSHIKNWGQTLHHTLYCSNDDLPISMRWLPSFPPQDLSSPQQVLYPKWSAQVQLQSHPFLFPSLKQGWIQPCYCSPCFSAMAHTLCWPHFGNRF